MAGIYVLSLAPAAADPWPTAGLEASHAAGVEAGARSRPEQRRARWPARTGKRRRCVEVKGSEGRRAEHGSSTQRVG
ncbi:unnamed protein product [Urochloa humidicola]